jgi:hypothetical protein
MLRSRMRTGILGLLVPALPIWFGLVGAGTAAAVEAVAEEDLAAMYAAQSLRVSIWLDKSNEDVYRRGEPIRVTFQTNEDAYAVLYHIDVDGRVAILWPTGRFGDGFVFGGHQYRLPASDGNRLRAGEHEGLGYVQAVVSRYPFDLRDLPIDFHHESDGPIHDVYVAGDPYLAMNEVNYTVTGLEDATDYVITNHVSYYVHRPVDHPRYLCSQCHDDGANVDPYRDTCTITIRHDYGWQNQWWTTYRYYPVYYYPTFFYVDPWSGYRWVNYWYDPWYRWPSAVVYAWPYSCYDWRYSPYWRWDSWTAYERGHRRYAPLTKPSTTRDRSVAATRTKSALVTASRPGEDRLRAMKERTVVRSSSGPAADARARRDGPAGGVAAETQRISRVQERFTPGSRTDAAPGLRLPDGTTDPRGVTPRSRMLRSGEQSPDRDDRVRQPRLDPPRSGTEAPRDPQQQVRPPVTPRRDGGRVWTNRRSSGQTETRPQDPTARPPARSRDDSRGSVRERAPQSPTPPPSPPPARSRDDSRGSVRERAPQSPSPPPSPPPSSPRRSSRGRTEGQNVHADLGIPLGSAVRGTEAIRNETSNRDKHIVQGGLDKSKHSSSGGRR